MNILTLVAKLFGAYGMAMEGFPILLMSMAISGPPHLYLTTINLEMASKFSTKYVVCFNLPKSNTLSLRPSVGALKDFFCDEVDFW